MQRRHRLPYVGENISRIAQLYLEQQSKSRADAVVESWSNVGGHCRDMLAVKYDSIGVGIAKGVNATGKECRYCVQLFLCGGYAAM